MATTEERLKILQMIQEGKISAEEGAKLLSALTSSAKEKSAVRRAGGGRSGGPKWLRVRVTDMSSGKSKVNVNLPLSLMEVGLKIGGRFVDELQDMDAEMQMLIEAIQNDVHGKIVEVDDEDSHVEVYIE